MLVDLCQSILGVFDQILSLISGILGISFPSVSSLCTTIFGSLGF